MVLFAKAMAANFGVDAIAPLWRELPSDFAERDPLFAALLLFHNGDLVTTNRLIAMVDARSLSESDTTMWTQLLAAVTTPSDAVPMLRDQWDGPRLSAALVIQYARDARALGHRYEFLPRVTDTSGAR